MAKSKLFNLAHFSQVAMPEGNMTLAWFLTDVVGVKADRWYTHIHRSEQGKHQGIVTQFLSDKSRRGTNNKILINYNSVPTITDTIYGYRFFVVSMIVLSKQDLAEGNDNISKVIITYANFSEYYQHMEEVAEKAKANIKGRRQNKNKEDKDGPTIPVIEKTMRFLKKLLDHLKEQEDKKKDDDDSSSGNDSSKSPLEHDSANNKKSSGTLNPESAANSDHGNNSNDNSSSGNNSHKSFSKPHSDDNDDEDDHTTEAEQQCVYNFDINKYKFTTAYQKKVRPLVIDLIKAVNTIGTASFSPTIYKNCTKNFVNLVASAVEQLVTDSEPLESGKKDVIELLNTVIKDLTSVDPEAKDGHAIDDNFQKKQWAVNACTQAIEEVEKLSDEESTSGSGSYDRQIDDSDNAKSKNLADTAVEKAEELVAAFEEINAGIGKWGFKKKVFDSRCENFPQNIDSIKNTQGLLEDKTQLNDAQGRIVGILSSKILKKYTDITWPLDQGFPSHAGEYTKIRDACREAINNVKQWDPSCTFPPDSDTDYDNKSVENSDKNSEEKRKISAPKSEGSENKSNNDDTDTQKKKTRSNDDDDEKIKTQSDKDDEKKAEDKVEQSFDDEDEEEGTFEEEDDSIAVPAAVDDAKKLIEDFKKVIATIGTEQFIGEKFRDARKKFSDNIDGIPSHGSTEGLKEAKKQIIALIREFIEKEITPKLSKATGKNKTRYERAKKACDEALDLATRWHFEEEEEEGDFKQDDENGKSEDDDGSGSGGENVAGSEDVKWAVGEAKKLIQEFKDMEKIVKTDKFKSSDFKKTCENFPTDIDNIFQADDSKLEQEEDMESAQKQITDLIQGYIDSIESVGGPTDTTMASTGYSFTQNRAVHQACDKAIEKVKAWAPPKH